MAVTQYIGSRYVPLFADPIEWSSSNTYEPLTIVIHEGNSYTSKQAVPKDIDISNEAFWALTGNYNAQVELYRRETALAKETADDAQADATAAQTDIDTLLPKADFSAENTVKKYVDDSVAEVQADIDSLKNEFALPDNFDGSNDYEKLQAAIAYAEQNNSGVIINRKFDITGHTLFFTKGIGNITGGRNRLTFVGLNNGEIYKGDSGYMFDASPRSGDIAFIGVSFKGDRDAERQARCNGFNLGSIIRLTTICCSFISLNIVFDGANATTVDTNIQSMRHYNDFIYDCYAYYKNGRSWDIYISGTLCESCSTFFNVDEINRCTISDSCIEGLSDYGIYLHNTPIGSSLSIDRNYFEANHDCIILSGYVLGCSICDNRFAGKFTSSSETVAIIDIHELVAGAQATKVDRNVYATQTTYPSTYLIWTSDTGQFFFGNNSGNITPANRFFNANYTNLTLQHPRDVPSSTTALAQLPAGTYKFSKTEFAAFSDAPIPIISFATVTVFGDTTLSGSRIGFIVCYGEDTIWHFYMFSQIAGVGTSPIREIS